LLPIRQWAEERFAVSADHAWRTIAPLARSALPATMPGLLLVGDAARVVEPFTGEGIYYALRSGELAAEAIIAGQPAGYALAHRALYRGRVWVNRLARTAVLHPRLTTHLLRLLPAEKRILQLLTAKVAR
jgi:flavin-dependent dehydrogenase